MKQEYLLRNINSSSYFNLASRFLQGKVTLYISNKSIHFPIFVRYILKDCSLGPRQDANETDGLQIRNVSVNMPNKQSQAADKVW